MSYNPNQQHGGPAGMAQSFNAMLSRSLQEQGQPEQLAEAPGQPASSLGKLQFSHIRMRIANCRRRLWRRLRRDTTPTATWAKRSGWRKRAAATDIAHRFTSASLFDLSNAPGHGRQYGPSSQECFVAMKTDTQ